MSAYDEDANLALRARERDSAAEEELYLKFRPLMGCWAYRVLRRRDYADDVADAAIVRLFLALPRFDPARGRFRSFAYCIAHNEWVSFLRGQRGRPEEQVPLPELERIESPGRVEDECVRRSVREAVGALPELERTAVLARFFVGVSNCALARSLGVTERSVRFRQGRALGRLRGALASVLRTLQCRAAPAGA
jgi:RNA polymerase sigma-70 factor (ECF subfamily)